MEFMWYSYLGAGQPAHDKVLVLQAIILILIIGGSFCSTGPLETSKGRTAGLRVEGVHYDGLCAFNLAATKWAALTLRFLMYKNRKESVKSEAFVIYSMGHLTFAQTQITGQLSNKLKGQNKGNLQTTNARQMEKLKQLK